VEGGEVVEEGAVKGDVGFGIPGVEVHRRGQVGAQDGRGDGKRVAARGFITEDDQEEILIGQRLLARQAEPLGQGVEHPRQFETAEDGFEVRRDQVSRITPIAGRCGGGPVCCAGLRSPFDPSASSGSPRAGSRGDFAQGVRPAVSERSDTRVERRTSQVARRISPVTSASLWAGGCGAAPDTRR